MGYVQMDSIHLGLIALYSCWLVILTAYNLVLGMCIRPTFIFLSMVTLNPNSLGQNIDVCFRPLIDELK